MPTTRRIVTMGVQVKMTGEDMTEYTKGLSGLSEDTSVQALELTFWFAERFRSKSGRVYLRSITSFKRWIRKLQPDPNDRIRD
jgi:hypothetical protein